MLKSPKIITFLKLLSKNKKFIQLILILKFFKNQQINDFIFVSQKATSKEFVFRHTFDVLQDLFCVSTLLCLLIRKMYNNYIDSGFTSFYHSMKNYSLVFVRTTMVCQVFNIMAFDFMLTEKSNTYVLNKNTHTRIAQIL